jgi:hypothetical protein
MANRRYRDRLGSVRQRHLTWSVISSGEGSAFEVIANAFETDSHRGAPYVPCPELPWQDWTLETYFLYASSKITSSE